MKLTKANCVFALAGLYSAADGEHDEENVKVIQQLIDEHFESSLTREKLEKALELACEDIADVFGNCPLIQFDCVTSRCEYCQDEYKECWKEYYMSEVFGDETN